MIIVIENPKNPINPNPIVEIIAVLLNSFIDGLFIKNKFLLHFL
jgi:hypothetical protein